MNAFMKTSLLLGVTIAAIGAFAASQPARAEYVGKYEKYCLDTPMGGGRDGGGGTYIDCRFATMAQCQASRMGVGGSCMLNPRLAFEQRGRTYRHY